MGKNARLTREIRKGECRRERRIIHRRSDREILSGARLMSSTMIYLAIFFISAAIPVAYYYIHRKSKHSLDLNERTLLSTNLGFFNGLFAFLLGFAIVTLWTHYIDAEQATVKEAHSLLCLYQFANLLPENGKLRKTIREYETSIIDDEWKEMEQHNRFSDRTRLLYEELWFEVHQLKPRGDVEKMYFASLLESLRALSEHRLQRRYLLDGHLYPLMWVIIIIGSVFSVVGFFYTSTEKELVQLIFDFILISMVLLNVWLISELNTPFGGYVKISPRAFVMVQDRMDMVDSAVERRLRLQEAKREKKRELQQESKP
jgi:hypothetical protein